MVAILANPQPIQQLSNDSADAAAHNRVPLYGQIAGTPDTGAAGIGDGITPWNSMIKWLTTLQLAAANGVASLDSGGQVPLSQLGNVPSGGGSGSGSGSSIVSENLGNSGTSITLLPASTAGAQQILMTNTATIQLPALPAAGVLATIVLSLVQNGTGGFNWGYAGEPVDYPAGVPTQVTTANFENIVILQCVDGAKWQIIPITSGPVPVSGLAFAVTTASGSVIGRYLGDNQYPGTQPSVATGQTVGDFYTDHSIPTFWIYNGSAFVDLVGGATSGVTVNAPFTFSVPEYSSASGGIWIPTHRRYTDLTSGRFGNISTSNTSAAPNDNGALINAALAIIGPLGLTGLLPPGTYGIKTPIVIGNGCANGGTQNGTTYPNGAVSTWTAELEGAYRTVGNGKSDKPINAPVTETCLQWTGGNASSATMVTIQGPTSAWGLRNIRIDGNAGGSGIYSKGPLLAMQVTAARAGECDGVSISNTINGLFTTTMQCTSANAVNTVDNVFRNLFISFTGVTSAGAPNGSSVNYSYGVLLGYDGTANGNSCYNTFDGINIIGGGTTASPLCYGFVFQGCDSNRVRDADITSDACALSVVFDYSQSNGGEWPASNSLHVLETGGINQGTGTNLANGFSVNNVGTPASSARGAGGAIGTATNEVLRVSQCNGYAPNPYAPNLIYDTPGVKGKVQLAAGTGNNTGSGFGVEFINSFGVSGNGATTVNGSGSVRMWYMNVAGVSAPQTLTYAVNQSTGLLTITSSSGADTSLIGYELVP
jgi:hypothetical protein